MNASFSFTQVALLGSGPPEGLRFFITTYEGKLLELVTHFRCTFPIVLLQ